MSQLGWQLRARHIIGATVVHKHHLAKIGSNRHLCVAIHSPSLSWPCLPAQRVRFSVAGLWCCVAVMAAEAGSMFLEQQLNSLCRHLLGLVTFWGRGQCISLLFTGQVYPDPSAGGAQGCSAPITDSSGDCEDARFALLQCGHSSHIPEGHRPNCLSQPGHQNLLQVWAAKTVSTGFLYPL